MLNDSGSSAANSVRAICLAAVAFSILCCTDKDKDMPVSSEKRLTSFIFEKSKNPVLNSDVYATILENKISASFPAKTDISKLVSTFYYAGAAVTVNGVAQTSGVTVNDFRNPVEYVVEAEDKSTAAYITSFTVTPESEKLITRFEIKKSLNPGLSDDIVFNINHAAGTIDGVHLKWIDSSALSQFVVSFEAGNAVVSINGKEAQSGITVIDFKNPIQIVTVSGNYDPRVYTASILCPQINATLPILRIDADGPILNKTDYVKAKLEIIGNGITTGLWDYSKEKIEIRLHGNSTLGLPKKPYRIKFPEKYSPLGLNHAKEKSWVLLANDCDKSLIRNAVALQISRIMQTGVTYRKFTPCTQFVDLYLNGQYDGNYHLTDQVEAAPGRVDVQTLKASDAGNTDKISGGYLLEIDGFSDSEPLYFTSPQNMKVTVKYPKDDDYAPEQAKWITDFFTLTENDLFSANFKDPINGWRKYINQASWIDYCIINELSGNSDAWWSTYISKERNVDYFVVGPVWDFDIAFNNDTRIPNAATSLMAVAAHDPKTWITRFMQDETFKAAMKARWNEKKGALLAINTYIDELAAVLDMSQKANFKRWDIHRQVLEHAAPPPASYEAAISQLKDYFQDRYNFLDKEFNKW